MVLNPGRSAVTSTTSADRFLVLVDRQRWLPGLLQDLKRASSLDAKVQTAADQVVERFRALSEQDLTDLRLLPVGGCSLATAGRLESIRRAARP